MIILINKDSYSKSILNEEGVLYQKKENKSKGKTEKEKEKEYQKQKNSTEHEKEREIQIEKAKFFTLNKESSKKIMTLHSPVANYKVTSDYKSPNFIKPSSSDIKYQNNQFHNTSRDKENRVESSNLRPQIASKKSKNSENHSRINQVEKSFNSKTKKTTKPLMIRSKIPEHRQDGNRFPNVESKIKDEINYHKEISKQYKKMKTNLKQFDPSEDNTPTSSCSRDSGGNKFIFVDKEDIRGIGTSPRRVQDSSRLPTDDRLLQSSSSYQRSTNHHQSSRTPMQENSLNRSKKIESTGKNEDISHYKTSLQHDRDTANNNVLYIANSFLNSPLMQHLSNQDSKTSDNSSKESNPITLKQQNERVDVNDFELKSPTQVNKSMNKRFYDDEIRVNNTGYKYADSIGGDYKLENRDRENISMLKDSQNRRYTELPPKDSSKHC